jgi:hypothetical protein
MRRLTHVRRVLDLRSPQVWQIRQEVAVARDCPCVIKDLPGDSVALGHAAGDSGVAWASRRLVGCAISGVLAVEDVTALARSFRDGGEKGPGGLALGDAERRGVCCTKEGIEQYQSIGRSTTRAQTCLPQLTRFVRPPDDGASLRTSQKRIACGSDRRAKSRRQLTGFLGGRHVSRAVRTHANWCSCCRLRPKMKKRMQSDGGSHPEQLPHRKGTHCRAGCRRLSNRTGCCRQRCPAAALERQTVRGGTSGGPAPSWRMR